MLLQTNSYIVPKDKRTEHARLIMRFRQTLARLGCDHFEAYEQVGANWSPTEATGRFVQIMRFRDRKHQQQVQAAERSDPAAQALIKEFCELINFPYQQQQGLFAVGFYTSILPGNTPRVPPQSSSRGTDAAPTVPTPEPGEPAPHVEPDEDWSHAEESVADVPPQSNADAPHRSGHENGSVEGEIVAEHLRHPDTTSAGQVEDLDLEEVEPPSREEDDAASSDRAMNR